ncbi:MAG: DUF1566 domain-containing protein [Saprospiraceae bacterium]
MKPYEELINKVKDLIRNNKTNKALELLAEEQLSSLDKQLILINSRYSKLKEEQNLGIIDDDTAQLRLNKINVELLGLADKIGKKPLVDKIEESLPTEVSEIPAANQRTTSTKEVRKEISKSVSSSSGNSNNKLYIGMTIGVLLVALIGYFGMQSSSKNAEKERLAKIELAKKQRAKVVKDSLQQVKLQAIETARRDSIKAAKQAAINRAENIKLGNSYLGGIIFYIDETGQHGLIMARGDQCTKPIPWFSETKGKALATDTGIYDGAKNTELLVAKFKEENHPAQLCANFKFGEYEDWYLPSKDELDLLYEYHKTLPRDQRLEPKYYWSSSESNSHDVYYRSFHNGKSYTWIKGNKAKVRAVKKF